MAIATVFVLAALGAADAVAQTDEPFELFQNDLGGFLPLAGELRTIDFETLPDGSPSQGGEHMTPAFNYTSWGVTFSTPINTPYIAGPPGNRRLNAFESFPLLRTWLIADLVRPSRAVGFEFPGVSWLRAYDIHGDLIAQDFFSAPGGPWFLGIISDIPIARVTADGGSNAAAMLTFMFNPTPEPCSAALLGLAALFQSRRRGATSAGKD